MKGFFRSERIPLESVNDLALNREARIFCFELLGTVSQSLRRRMMAIILRPDRVAHSCTKCVRRSVIEFLGPRQREGVTRSGSLRSASERSIQRIAEDFRSTQNRNTACRERRYFADAERSIDADQAPFRRGLISLAVFT